MKGVIFRQLELFVCQKFDETTWEAIYQTALPELVTQDPFVGPMTYPDEDMVTLAVHASNHLELSLEVVLKEYGRFLLPNLISLAPEFVKGHATPKSFLLTVEDVIHVEVEKMYEGTYLPTFTYAESEEDVLDITYSSDRKLFTFFEGLIEGVAEYFQCSVSFEQVEDISDTSKRYILRFS